MTFSNSPSLPHRRPRARHVWLASGGFTLIETMMVVAITAVLLAMAMPSFRDVIDRYRVRRAIEDLSATIYLARTEAIKRGGHVSIAKTTGADCSTDQTWSCGWTVFEDVNENGALDAATDTLLQSSLASPGVYVMFFKSSGAGGPKSMTMNRWGSANGMGAFSFKVTPATNSNVELNMELCMSSGGRLRTVKGTETCAS